MSDYHFNDYDKFIGKNITVFFECGYKCKKLDCKLLEYSEKSSKEKLIILKAYNNMIYYLNCNKIIYWIAEYRDMLIEKQDVLKSNTKPIEPNTIAETEIEDLFLKESEDKKPLPLETSVSNIQLQDVELLQHQDNHDFSSTAFLKEYTSLTATEDTAYNELQENKVINKLDTLLVPVSNAVIIPYEHNVNYIMTDMKLNYDKSITDYKRDCDSSKIQENYNHKDNYKKNVLKSPIAEIGRAHV